MLKVSELPHLPVFDSLRRDVVENVVVDTYFSGYRIEVYFQNLKTIYIIRVRSWDSLK
jgi:hypothetical protein